MNESIGIQDPKHLGLEDEFDKPKDIEQSDEDDFTPFDLDVPGTELGNEDELIGEEDEENNYYSIGGDNHNNLEESED
ncbi:MAG: hypothetical protein QM530_08320 [Phycisphaerales bacterium]|nr:hypothetical protein [Phycisphaerales bacterium]